MVRIFFFLLGFSLTLLGSIYCICYLNLTTVGYNLREYGEFIIRKPECVQALVGLVILCLSIFIPGGEENELYL